MASASGSRPGPLCSVVSSQPARQVPCTDRADRISELYHRQIWNETTQEIARDRIHWICSQAQGRRVLDVGCSQGIASILLAREGFEVVGIDVSPDAIAFAQAEAERAPDAVRERLTFLAKDLHDLDVEPFDTVILGEVIEHQANVRRFVEHCASFVAENGRLVLTTPFGLHPHPDHKAVLYPRQVVAAVTACLELDAIDIADGYIRCTSVRTAAREARTEPVDPVLLRLTEQGARASQARLYGLLDQKSQVVATRARQAERLEQEKAEALAGAVAARAQLEQSEHRAGQLEQAAELLRVELADLHRQQLATRAAADEEARLRQNLEDEVATLRCALADREDALEESAQLVADAQRGAATWARRFELIEAEADDLAQTNRRLRSDLKTLRRQQAAQEAQAWRASRLEIEVRQLRAELQRRRNRLLAEEQAHRAALHESAALRAVLADAQVRADQSQQSAISLEAELRKVERERTDLHQVLDGMSEDLEALATGAQTLRRTLSELEADRIEAVVAAQSLRQAQDELTRDLAVERRSRSALKEQNNRLEQQNQQARRDLERLRQLSAALQLKLERTSQTISFRLGNALLQSSRSPRHLMALPGQLLALRREARDRRTRRSRRRAQPDASALDGVDGGSAQPCSLPTLTRLLALEPKLAAAEVTASAAPAVARARLVNELAKAYRASDLPAAVALGRTAFELDPQPWRAKWLASLLYDAGAIAEPARLIAEARNHLALSGRDATRAELILGLDRVRTSGIEVPAHAPRGFDPALRRVLYVAHRSLPHDAVGYTMRSQGLLEALDAAGYDMQVATRVGYPWDEPAGRALSADVRTEDVDGIAYARLPGPGVGSTSLDVYIHEATKVLVDHGTNRRPGLIHAASNYVNALPALIAARRLGLPFVYEVRGLWEFTAASKTAGFETSERFQLMRTLETQVAREADRVITISEALRRELFQRGVAADRIRLAPNAVDIDRFKPADPDQRLAERLKLRNRFVVGFAGTVTAYEGLDHLISAMPTLLAEGIDAALLIVGTGDAVAGLRAMAEHLEIVDRVVFTGWVPTEQVPAYYSLIDVAAFPREQCRVCELVPPLKPVEAMAMGKAVVAADLPALAETVRERETGILVPSGDRDALAAALADLARHPAKRARLGQSARAFVSRERTWHSTAATVAEVYRELGL